MCISPYLRIALPVTLTTDAKYLHKLMRTRNLVNYNSSSIELAYLTKVYKRVSAKCSSHPSTPRLALLPCPANQIPDTNLRTS